MARFWISICLILPAALGAQDYYFQGKAAYGKKNYDLARQLFEKSLSTNPSNGNPCFYLGYMLDNQNRKELAVSQYRRGVDLNMDPDLREKSFWKIVLYYKYVQDWDNLAVYSEKFLKYRDIPQVRAFLEEAKEKRDPNTGRIRDLTESAEKKRAASDWAGAESDYAQLLGIRWDDTWAWNLASVQMQLRKYPEAARYLTKLIDRKASWEYHYKRGICNYYQRLLDNAMADFSTARRLRTKPDASFRAFLALGEGLVLLEQGKLEASKGKLEESLKLKEGDAARAALAKALFASGQSTESERYSASIKSEKDRLLPMLLVMSRAERKKEERAIAFRSLETLLTAAAEDDYPLISTSGAIYLAGRQACIQGMADLCLRAFERIPASDKPGIGKIVEQIYPGEKKSAADVFREREFLTGKAQLELGRTDAAIASLRKVDDMPAAQYHLAQAYAKKGSESVAMEYLQKAGQARPDYWEYAKKAEAFLALARQSPDFAYFLEHRKPRPPEPKPEVTHEKQTDRRP